LECLDEDSILGFVDGSLDDARRASAQGHIATCPSCFELVATAAGGDPERVAGSLSGRADSEGSGLAPGTTVGRYVILNLVGRGGMGEVYAAYDPQLDRKVALKLLHQWDLGRAPARTARDRLLREAKAIARLSHPNVVVVHDAGAIDDAVHGDRVFLAMEFVEGETLAAWLGAAPRTWRAIRDVFAAAGEGLAAAHEAGLVHRDFKPQNVMVGPDRSVRVMDFGLASDTFAVEARDAAPLDLVPESSGAAPTPRTVALTRSGVLLGTPLYMAPEQFSGRATDARTDQFSFCVALHEALHGERPFPNDSLAALVDAVVNGRLREPSQRGRVPAWLRKLVVRGLRVEPSERFPTMRELLTNLKRDPALQRRRVILGAALGALLLTGGALGHLAMGRTGAAALCRGAESKLAPTWEYSAAAEGRPGTRREAVRARFLASGVPRAGEIWGRVASLLDRYANQWVAMFGEACEATHVRGEQPVEVLDLRMDCLDTSRESLRALTDVFVTADAAVVREAVGAANALPGLARCADVPVLRAVVPPARDPATRRRVESLLRRVADVRALRDAGRWKEGLALVGPVVEDARALGYQPIIAEALSLRAWLHYWNGEPKAAETTYEQALWAAEASRHDEVAAEAAIQLAGITAWEMNRLDDGERWAHLADAILRRMGTGHARLEGWLAHNSGLARQRAGDFQGAEAELRRAVALRQSAEGGGDAEIATSLNSLAEVLGLRGKFAAAIETADLARAKYDRVYGPGSAISATVLSNQGEWLNSLGRHQEALDDFRRAVVEEEAALGPDHVFLAYPLTGTGVAQVALHRAGEAVPILTRALDIRERHELKPEVRAETRFALARALWETGSERDRARTLASAARAEYTKVPNMESHTGEIDAWLATRAAPTRGKR
jgi:eukaryotic-like serine/threonine-protein kinase